MGRPPVPLLRPTQNIFFSTARTGSARGQRHFLRAYVNKLKGRYDDAELRARVAAHVLGSNPSPDANSPESEGRGGSRQPSTRQAGAAKPAAATDLGGAARGAGAAAEAGAGGQQGAEVGRDGGAGARDVDMRPSGSDRGDGSGSGSEGETSGDGDSDGDEDWRVPGRRRRTPAAKRGRPAAAAAGTGSAAAAAAAGRAAQCESKVKAELSGPGPAGSASEAGAGYGGMGAAGAGRGAGSGASGGDTHHHSPLLGSAGLEEATQPQALRPLVVGPPAWGGMAVTFTGTSSFGADPSPFAGARRRSDSLQETPLAPASLQSAGGAHGGSASPRPSTLRDHPSSDGSFLSTNPSAGGTGPGLGFGGHTFAGSGPWGHAALGPSQSLDAATFLSRHQPHSSEPIHPYRRTLSAHPAAPAHYDPSPQQTPLSASASVAFGRPLSRFPPSSATAGDPSGSVSGFGFGPGNENNAALDLGPVGPAQDPILSDPDGFAALDAWLAKVEDAAGIAMAALGEPPRDWAGPGPGVGPPEPPGGAQPGAQALGLPPRPSELLDPGRAQGLQGRGPVSAPSSDHLPCSGSPGDPWAPVQGRWSGGDHAMLDVETIFATGRQSYAAAGARDSAPGPTGATRLGPSGPVPHRIGPDLEGFATNDGRTGPAGGGDIFGRTSGALDGSPGTGMAAGAGSSSQARAGGVCWSGAPRVRLPLDGRRSLPGSFLYSLDGGSHSLCGGAGTSAGIGGPASGFGQEQGPRGGGRGAAPELMAISETGTLRDPGGGLPHARSAQALHGSLHGALPASHPDRSFTGSGGRVSAAGLRSASFGPSSGPHGTSAWHPSLASGAASFSHSQGPAQAQAQHQAQAQAQGYQQHPGHRHSCPGGGMRADGAGFGAASLLPYTAGCYRSGDGGGLPPFRFSLGLPSLHSGANSFSGVGGSAGAGGSRPAVEPGLVTLGLADCDRELLDCLRH
ncbi:hypothetical protein HYH03_016077 [Edaphochlamys debaryana]|uniref:Uncharacterized protein n=1 Tax=Edaphochlamys debaryana TaxID=47281 RepID=A0A836BRZ9_9CHLO|nr:hypothetical protein HYH03_016077 [Edaphochlamys debaryana]|eukprot:KAG2485188.1 hypothetical protein HYH03_016077 [Edaphochlamys debaryana]